MELGLARTLRKAADCIHPWRAEIAALRSRLIQLEQLCDNRFLAASGHLFSLEQLLVSSPAMVPPGALAAANSLGNPAVSVIMPTYNRASFVTEAILSVQEQSFQAWELAIVDDGSTDDTIKIVNKFTQDLRIKYIWQEHAGAARARNRGIQQTSAPLIAYIDSDNTWHPNFLRSAVFHLASTPHDDTVYGALVSYIHGLQSKCILWKPFDRNKLIKQNYIDANVFVHRRELVDRFGGWDEELRRFSDWDLVLRYTLDKPAHALKALGAYYRECDQNRISNIEDPKIAEMQIKAKWTKNSLR